DAVADELRLGWISALPAVNHHVVSPEQLFHDLGQFPRRAGKDVEKIGADLASFPTVAAHLRPVPGAIHKRQTALIDTVGEEDGLLTRLELLEQGTGVAIDGKQVLDG